MRIRAGFGEEREPFLETRIGRERMGASDVMMRVRKELPDAQKHVGV